jgi:hypothetical protein
MTHISIGKQKLKAIKDLFHDYRAYYKDTNIPLEDRVIDYLTLSHGGHLGALLGGMKNPFNDLDSKFYTKEAASNGVHFFKVYLEDYFKSTSTIPFIDISFKVWIKTSLEHSDNKEDLKELCEKLFALSGAYSFQY